MSGSDIFESFAGGCMPGGGWVVPQDMEGGLKGGGVRLYQKAPDP